MKPFQIKLEYFLKTFSFLYKMKTSLTFTNLAKIITEQFVVDVKETRPIGLDTVRTALIAS